MQSMKDNQVWILVELLLNGRTVRSKWLFKKKTDMDGNVHTFKARLVAKGYTQTYGVDYGETFSPVADIRAIRILLAILAFYDYEIWQIDVKTAFLNGHLSEDVYMVQPEVFVDPNHPNKVCKLQRSIYGLKQASRSWNKSRSSVAFLILYVDDILLIGNNVTMLQEVKSWLCKCFSMKDLGEAAYILGIKIIRDRSKRLIALSQSAYLEKILKKFRMENSKKGYTPMMEKPDYRKSQGAKTPSEQNPGEIHWTTVKTILEYLRNTKDMVLVYGAKPEAKLKVSCYADVSFQADKDDTKSQTGYVFVLNGGVVDWKSAKQSTTAMSSTEAEYIVVAEASMESVWMRKFIDGLGDVVPSNKRPMEMLCDNEPIIAIVVGPDILKGAKHFQRKYHYIHEVIQEREIVLKKVHTYDNVADLFTKPMPFNKHFEHTMAIGIVPASSLMNTKDMVLVYGAKPEAELKVSCYTDASFQTDKDDTKSQTGYVFVLNGGAVDWKSTKQSTNAMSSTESEYIAAAEVSMEAVWMRKFIDGLGDVVPSNKRPMEMLCDNEPAIAIAADPGILKGARHFQRKYHYIREVIQEREIVLKKVHTDDNVVDPFTKPMSFNKHFEHTMAIEIVPASSVIDILKATSDIERIDPAFKTSFNLKVSNGSNILFWKDPWCNGGTRLMDNFPRLFALESSQDCMVSDRWCFENGNCVGRWSWRYHPRGRAINNLSSLLNMIGNLSLSPDGTDKWSWAYEASGLFKVKTLSDSIQNLQLVDCSLGKNHSCNSWIPRKVNINIWRASLDRLPTRLNLVSRGIPISDDSCPFCEAVAEDIDHCLINCPKVIRVWRILWNWWNLGSCTIFLSFSIRNIAMENVCNIGCFRLNKILHGVFKCTLWAIWKWRNKLVNALRFESNYKG
ncbi:retrotransposon protein, putative, ty1-copia subclass [Tanacetum coccineum]